MQLTLVQTIPVTGVVMVTTPQQVAVIDAIKAMNMFMLPNVNVPILGVVENMSWFTPAELPDHQYFLLAKVVAKPGAKSRYRFIGSDPLVQAVMEGSDAGVPCVTQDGHPGRSFSSGQRNNWPDRST